MENSIHFLVRAQWRQLHRCCNSRFSFFRIALLCLSFSLSLSLFRQVLSLFPLSLLDSGSCLCYQITIFSIALTWTAPFWYFVLLFSDSSLLLTLASLTHSHSLSLHSESVRNSQHLKLLWTRISWCLWVKSLPTTSSSQTQRISLSLSLSPTLLLSHFPILNNVSVNFHPPAQTVTHTNSDWLCFGAGKLGGFNMCVLKLFIFCWHQKMFPKWWVMHKHRVCQE